MPPNEPHALRALLSASADGLDLSFRPMFGGVMDYLGGKPFASLSDRGLALKLGSADRDALFALGGEPLRYEPDGPPSRSYGLLPPALLNVDALHGWVERSAAHVAALPAPERRRS